ncbi:hypothetical protein F5J12DRAFT_951766 [Pisolithus orientalis]|uniref:uncharacterized protein n=1 Tax=Pisolithus orientalis TaxID=936130 RepID=UPI0022241D69|nr:uncharacterized protein F5J12DRAFT_951766 [Pisolithus orientalis]KAI5999792.1 hypothetical protein F5J12DRAFT_951766 [Pisolithus orientalis]
MTWMAKSLNLNVHYGKAAWGRRKPNSTSIIDISTGKREGAISLYPLWTHLNFTVLRGGVAEPWRSKSTGIGVLAVSRLVERWLYSFRILGHAHVPGAEHSPRAANGHSTLHYYSTPHNIWPQAPTYDVWIRVKKRGVGLPAAPRIYGDMVGMPSQLQSRHPSGSQPVGIGCVLTTLLEVGAQALTRQCHISWDPTTVCATSWFSAY